MKQRIITAIVAGIPLVLLVIIGGLPFTFLSILLALIAISELLKMKKTAYLSPPGIIAFLLTFIIVMPDDWYHQIFIYSNHKIDFFLFALLLLLALTVISKNRFNFDEVSFVLMSSLYAGFGFYYFYATRMIPEGLPTLFFVLLLIWATDSGAYFIGRAMGKRKLWPEISPNKTVEGALGGVLSAVAVSILFQLFYPLFDFTTAIIIAAIVAVFGQVGDLVESALKRHYGVKDSGQLLPGHGGILDRFDSLIFVLPILHLFHLV